MATFRTQIPSTLSVPEAFAAMAAFERAAEWDPSVVEARRLSEGEPRLGARFRVVARFGGRQVPLEYELVRHEPPSRFTVEARNPSFTSRDTITVEPAGGGSLVTYDALLELRGLRRLFDPFFQAAFTRVGREAEAGLRRFLNPSP